MHTLSSASLVILRFWLSRPFGWCVSACSRDLAESGARVGDVRNRFLWVPVRAVIPVPSWCRISLHAFPTRWVSVGRCVSIGNDTAGRFMLGFVPRSIWDLQVWAVSSDKW